MKKHFVTYGDDNYINQREVIKESALSSCFFDEVHLFTNHDIDAVFYQQTYKAITLNRGGGYWIWKPYFIKKVLDTLADNDILIYCDAGCIINTEGRDRFNEYIHMLSASPTHTIDFSLRWEEYQYTKQEVFNHFNASDEMINSKQLHSTVIMLQKCAHTMQMIEKWYNTAIEYPLLFTDEKELTQHPKFIDHRHDQSIFSIIRKTYGTNIIDDETCYAVLETGRKFPFWGARIKG